MRKTSIGILFFFITFLGLQAYSQCEVSDNKFFKAGETLTYDLYFKYGLITSKAGNARLSTQSTTYNGQPAYKMSLVSHSTGVARNFFKLDDTLVCYMSDKLRPLAYLKDAHEGKEYTVEKQTYNYQPSGNIDIHAIRIKNGQEKYNVTLKANTCTFDMMSIIFYARTLPYENMKENTKTNVVFISGKKKVNMQIFYKGIQNVSANNGKTYACYKLTLAILDDAFSNPEDAMKVYVTSDLNRLPIQMESKLNVGSSRAVLKTYSGLKNQVGQR